jgi:hypothetical protein
MVYARGIWLVLAVPVGLGACNAILGNDSWTLQGNGPGSEAGADASVAGDSSRAGADAPPQVDQQAPDSRPVITDGSAATDSSIGPDSVAADDSGLDPCLVLPAADAAPCSPIGNETECGLGECLIASTGPEGRCQMCQGQGMCSGHADAPCDVAEDCDIGWACYCHACTLVCRLATPQTCGASQCVNVGNVTEGVCLPPN